MKATLTYVSYKAVYRSLLFLTSILLSIADSNAQAPLVAGSTYWVNGIGVDLVNPKDTFMNLGGTYTGGAPTTTTGVINYMNINGLTGSSTTPITIMLLNTYSGVENTTTTGTNGTACIQIGNPSTTSPGIPGQSSSRRVVIKPASGLAFNITTTLNLGSNQSLVRFNGSSYVSIDGESATGAKNITFSIPNATGTSVRVIDVIPTTGQGSQGLTIRNCNIIGNSTTTAINTYAGIYVGGINPASNAAQINAQFLIENNNIYAVQNGIYFRGVGTAGPLNHDVDHVIRRNTIGGYTYPNGTQPTTFIGGAINAAGIAIMNNRGTIIEGNIIRNSLPNTTGFMGIQLSNLPSTLSMDSMITINGNQIYNLTTTANGGIFGIRMNLGTHTQPLGIRMINNVIANISSASGFQITQFGNYPVGIAIEDNSTNVGVELYNNTINLYGNNLLQNGSSACLVLGLNNSTATAGVYSKNNIFVNRMGKVLGSGTNMANIYGIVVSNLSNTSTPFAASNYNNYHINTNAGGYAYIGFAGSGSIFSGQSKSRVSINHWRAYTGDDANSRTDIPPFVGVNDTLAAISNGTGSLLATSGQNGLVSTDVNGTTRSSTPSIGAYEFTINSTLVNPPLIGGTTYDINNVSNWPTNSSSAGRSFANVTDAITYLNAYGVSGTGAITLRLTSGYAGEGNNYIPAVIDYPGITTASRTVVLTTATGVPNTITIPNQPFFQYGAIFRLMGARFFTIDGNQRNLTFNFPTAASAATTRVIALVPSEMSPTSDVTIRNCVIQGHSSTTTINTHSGIFLGSPTVTNSTLSTPIGGNNNNSFRNNLIMAVQNGVYLRGVYAASALYAGQQDKNNVVYGNTIGGDIAPSGTLNTTYIGGAASSAGIYLKGQAGTSVDSNIVHNTLNSSSNAFRGIDLDPGETFSRDSNVMITRNFIYNLYYTAAAGYAYGIRVNVATDENRKIYIANNSIAKIGGAGGGNGFVQTNPAGIYLEGTATIINAGIEIYNNTINLSGTTLSAGASSAAIAIAGTIQGGIKMRNNLLINRLGSASGASALRFGVIIQGNTNVFATPNGLSNNNVIFAGAPNSSANLMGSSSNITNQYPGIGAWQAYTGQDQNSYSFGAGFANDSMPDIDLAFAGPVYAGGAPIAGITRDIYGNLRSTTAPNIGAVEFAQVFSPLTGGGVYYINGVQNPPTVSTTAPNPGPLAGSFSTINRAFQYINANGVNSNTGPAAPIQLIIANGYPGEGDTLISPLSNYPRMNSNRVIVMHPDVNKTFVITTTGGSNGPYGANSSLIRLNGAAHFVIDGSNNGTNSRDLTFQLPASATQASSKVIDLVPTSLPNTNITIKNCNILGNSNTSTIYNFAGIYMGGSTATPSNPVVARNDSNTFENNFIGATRYGIYMRGLSSSGSPTTRNQQDRGNRVIMNRIGGDIAPSSGTLPTNYWGSSSDAAGIFLMAQSGTIVDSNVIKNNVRTGPIPKGIELTSVGFPLSGDSNITISRNTIYNIITNTQQAAYGIYMNLVQDSFRRVNILNNMISGISSLGSSASAIASNPYGIYIDGTLPPSGAGIPIGVTINNNTINLGAASTLGSTAVSAAVGFANAIRSGVTLRSNILQNRLGRSSLSNGTYAVLVGSVNIGSPALPVSPFTRIDNNNYYAAAPGGTGNFIAGYNAVSGTVTGVSTITAMQNYTKQDTMSISFVAPFVSDTVLTFANLTNVFEGAGANPALTPTDIVGTTRNSPSDLGAWEFNGTYADSVAPRVYNVSTLNNACGTGPFSVDLRVYEKNLVSDTLYYRVGQGPVQTQQVTNVVGPQREYIITSLPSDSSIVYWVSLNDGATPPNNVQIRDTFSTSISKFPYSYGFDAPNLNHWMVEQVPVTGVAMNPALGWQFPSQGTTANPNFAQAYSGNAVALFPANTLPTNFTSRIISPCFDLSQMTPFSNKPVLRFWMSQNPGGAADQLNVKIGSGFGPGGSFIWSSIPVVLSAVRPSSAFPFPFWKQYDVCIPDYLIGIPGVRIAFEGVAKGVGTTGPTAGGNFMIDSIIVFDDFVNVAVAPATAGVVCSYDSLTVTIPNTSANYTYKLLDSTGFGQGNEISSRPGNGGSLAIRAIPPTGKDSVSLYVSVTNSLAVGCNLPNLMSQLPKYYIRRFKNGPFVAPGTPFSGAFNAGTATTPDAAIIGDTITYRFVPPSGLPQSGYGTSWTLLNPSFVNAESGTVPVNLAYVAPTSTTAGGVRIQTYGCGS